MSISVSDAWLDELRSRVSLEEVVSEYVPLKQKGRRYWGCCPFHNEKTASFSVDTEAQLYYCFGCHKGGTVITFVMEMERMEFQDAVRLLADRAHMDVPERGSNPTERAMSRNERERIYEANREAARFFHALLKQDEGAEALSYLYGRGLNDSDIRRFGLGASPRSRDALMKHLEAQGFELPILQKAGLIARRDSGTSDMFRNRVMFPIINAQGRVLGFGGRAMGDAQPKYLNTPDTPVFNKRQGLYAINFAHKERAAGRMVLVEGYMDTVSLRKYGVQDVVATLGTALTEEQARLMKRYVPEVWISYDGDPPGQKAALRALDILEQQGLPAKVIDYPGGMDPDDFVKANGLKGFESLPKYDAAGYRLMRAKDGLDLAMQDDLTQYTLRACEILKRIKNPVEMENHLRALARETGYDREILLRQIGVTPQQSAPPETRRRVRRADAAPKETNLAEEALITLLSRGMIPNEMIHADDFSNALRGELAQWLLDGKQAAAYIERIDDESRRAQAARALNYSPLPTEREDAERLAEDCLQALRRQRAGARTEQIMDEIGSATSEEKISLYQQLDAMLRTD